MLSFAFKSMATRKAKLVMTALSVVIAASVALLAYDISTQVSEGIVNTAAKYDIIIGPSGSATQLAMNTMFFTDKPLGTIPYSVIDDLNRSGQVNAAIPFSMGDSYNAAPIVGTDPALLSDKALLKGEMFDQPMEAVVGYDVAKTYNLSPGDQIISSHGLSHDGAAHADHPLTVVGVLRRTDTAYDNAVFTPVSTIWELHEHHDGDHDEDHDEDQQQRGRLVEAADDLAGEQVEGTVFLEDAHEEHTGGDGEHQVEEEHRAFHEVTHQRRDGLAVADEHARQRREVVAVQQRIGEAADDRARDGGDHQQDGHGDLANEGARDQNRQHHAEND